jgi:hypothetical protein
MAYLDPLYDRLEVMEGRRCVACWGPRGHQVDREAQFGLLREAIEVIAHGSILRRIFPKQYGVTMLGLSVVRSRTRLVILIATTRASFGPHPSAPRENPA